MVAHRENATLAERFIRTLKYGPAFPACFGSIQDARAHGHDFFPWYNTAHRYTGLGLLAPSDVHHGLAEARVAERAVVLTTAYATHPERFHAGRPQPRRGPRRSGSTRPRPERPRRRSYTKLDNPVSHFS